MILRSTVSKVDKNRKKQYSSWLRTNETQHIPGTLVFAESAQTSVLAGYTIFHTYKVSKGLHQPIAEPELDRWTIEHSYNSQDNEKRNDVCDLLIGASNDQSYCKVNRLFTSPNTIKMMEITENKVSTEPNNHLDLLHVSGTLWEDDAVRTVLRLPRGLHNNAPTITPSE